MAAGDEGGTIETEVHGDVTLVSLLGEWDISNAGTLRQHLQGAVGSGRGLVVSLMRADFIDASVVNILFGLNDQMQLRERRLVLHVNTASIVRRVLDVSGLAATLACTASIEDAVAIATATQGGSEWDTQ
jgi:anti-anti-sigma factor